MAARLIGNPRTAWVLLSGVMAFVTLLLGFPLVANIIYSFSEVRFSGLFSPRWLGLSNYLAVLADPLFWKAAQFSVAFGLVATGAEVLFGMLLALFLAPLVKRHRWVMGLLLLPMMISPALLGVMYRLILNDSVGIIPQYLELAGFHGNLLDARWAFWTVVTIEIFQWTPFSFLCLLTSYEALPMDIYEAAKIDSAGAFTGFVYITLPLMSPAVLITSFIRFIDSCRVFDHIYVLTGGGPGVQTTSISIYIYKLFYKQERIGPAVAASIILLFASILALRFLTPMFTRGPR